VYFASCLKGSDDPVLEFVKIAVDHSSHKGKTGSRDSFLIEEDNLRGVMIFEGRLILVSAHYRALLPPGRDPAVELRNNLLHEMQHAAVDLARPLRKGADSHSRRFLLQLRKLEAAGESSLRDQVRFYSLTPFCRLLASLL
jgi:hypothetical protein